MDIRDAVRSYILENHFKGSAAQSLHDDTPLMSTGILDSIGVLGLIDFLERTFQIEFTPRELDRDRLETIESIEEAVRKKLGGGETA